MLRNVTEVLRNVMKHYGTTVKCTECYRRVTEPLQNVVGVTEALWKCYRTLWNVTGPLRNTVWSVTEHYGALQDVTGRYRTLKEALWIITGRYKSITEPLHYVIEQLQKISILPIRHGMSMMSWRLLSENSNIMHTCHLLLIGLCLHRQTKMSETVLHFCKFLVKTFHLEPDYIVRKPMKRRFQRYDTLSARK